MNIFCIQIYIYYVIHLEYELVCHTLEYTTLLLSTRLHCIISSNRSRYWVHEPIHQSKGNRRSKQIDTRCWSVRPGVGDPVSLPFNFVPESFRTWIRARRTVDFKAVENVLRLRGFPSMGSSALRPRLHASVRILLRTFCTCNHH